MILFRVLWKIIFRNLVFKVFKVEFRDSVWSVGVFRLIIE